MHLFSWRRRRAGTQTCNPAGTAHGQEKDLSETSGSREKERAQLYLKFLDKRRATTLQAIYQNEFMLEQLRMRLHYIDEDIAAEEQKMAQ
ncbi:hypothetical protein N7537_003231 [Penicillium hordei]|uniref:Uncharacterized protein n=1 Tax=Penicillium hordei TaxID=40994 RepID=A0AAD6MPI9_9EURO|nr:uncharacterized protein N7537_003231 [Penicillium hordei]KAJ5618117.1 hypothetical protein N7537_003231 [Penicillium hordei]